MQNNEKLFISRMNELSQRAYTGQTYIYTEFLTLGQQTLSSSMKLQYPPVFSGGYDFAERQIAAFGSEEDFGYAPYFPISVLKIAPSAPKFAKPLSHRDFLGSLMSLGMRREMFGDILVLDNCGYVFVLGSATDHIKQSLESVSSVAVTVTECDTVPSEAIPVMKESVCTAASERLDALCSSVFDLSRSDSDSLISKGSVFINGIECTDRTKKPSPGDRISVRGYGKFIFNGTDGQTRHGKTRVKVKIY